jgi:hypothetical protein
MVATETAWWWEMNFFWRDFFFGLKRGQLTELGNTDIESWAKESFEIATKFAYRNGQPIGSPRSTNIDCSMIAAAPVLPAGYVISASRIADRRMILTGCRLADLLTRVSQTFD